MPAPHSTTVSTPFADMVRTTACQSMGVEMLRAVRSTRDSGVLSSL